MSPSPWRSTSLALAAAVALGLTPALAATAAPVPSAPAAPIVGPAAPAEPAAPDAAREPLPTPSVEAPTPDLLDVDIAQGGLADAAQDRTTTSYGADGTIAADPALGRDVISFDGTNAVRYDFTEDLEATEHAFTLECTVRFDGGLHSGTSEDTGNFCGAKEAGGFSLTAYGSTLKAMVNVDGDYYGAGVDVVEGVWYHVTGVWDGETIALYIDGEKVAEEPTEGEAMQMPKDDSHHFFLGADVNSSGGPQFNGTVSMASAGIYSRALSAEEVTARYVQTVADRAEEVPSFTLTSPEPGTTLTGSAELAGTVEHEELLAGDLELTLDGEPVALGDEIGPGLAEGEHTLAYTGIDAFGEAVEGSYTLTTSTIPSAGGTSEQTGEGSAQLIAQATSPTGEDLTTTFLEGEVSSADGSRQGTIPATSFAADGSLPADVELEEAADVPDALHPSDEQTLEAPVSADSPVLETTIPFTTAGQTVMWRGELDPSRQVNLLLLSTETGRYEVVDSARGSSTSTVQLSAPAGSEHDSDGSIRALVVGVDPFADDLDNPVQESFEDPDSYDFSLLHLTDTQYLSEGATEKATEQERAEWAAAYEDSYRWLAENAEERKVAFVAHTGDVIENWNTGATDRDVAVEEMEFASRTQELLEDTGIPHAVVPGNHDNLGGADSGPDSLYNEYFGPERYEALAASDSWKQAGAEFHPWRSDDAENSYTLFEAAGREFITVNLGYDVTEEEAQWASDVLDQYPSRNAILLTHAYNKPSDSPDGRGGHFSHDGVILEEKVLAEHPNVALVLSGHEHGVSINVRRDAGQTGNNVVELLADYQFYEVGSDQLGLTEVGEYDGDTGLRFGSSFFRLLQFDLERGEMAVDTYSPYLDEFGAAEYDTKGRYDGTEDDFRLPVQFEGRTSSFRTDALLGLTPSDQVIGEVTHASGIAATTSWDGLADGTPYGWFAVSRDAADEADPRQVQVEALEAGPEERAEGVVQFSAFTATGAAQDDESELPGEPGQDAPAPGGHEQGGEQQGGGSDEEAADGGSGSQDSSTEDSGAEGPAEGTGGTDGSDSEDSVAGGDAAADGGADISAPDGEDSRPAESAGGASQGSQQAASSPSAAPSGALARTGAELLPWAGAGAVLVLLGGALALRHRRRRG